MFLHKSALDGGNIGPSVHLLHGCGLTLVGISVHSFNDEVAVGFSIAIFCWPIRLYVCPRWVKTETKFKFTFDLRNLHYFIKNWKAFMQETNGFGFDLLRRRAYLQTELAKLETELKD